MISNLPMPMSELDQGSRAKFEIENLPLIDEEEYPFTNFLWDRKLDLWPARLYIGVLFFIVGVTQGYRGSAVLILQENGASYEDQSFFTLSDLPYSFKIVLAPIIDLFWSKKIGKCKTWVFGSSLIIFTVLISFTLLSDGKVHPENVGQLCAVWTLINTVTILLQITAEVWLVKIFENSIEKGKAAGMSNISQTLGFFFGYNVFIPLNDVEWLNTYIFTSNPVTTPLMTNKGILIFTASLTLAAGLFTILFIAEKQCEKPFGDKPIRDYIRSIPKFFTLKSMQLLLTWIFIAKIFRVLIEESLSLKLLDLGIKKTFFVNLGTILFPLTLLAISLTTKFIKVGYICKANHLINGYMAILLFVTWYIYYDLEQNNNVHRTKILIVISSIFERVYTNQLLQQAFVNTVASPEFGSTFLTLTFAVSNASMTLPTSLGLKLVDMNLMPYHVLAMVCCVANVAVICVTYIMAVKLDKLDKRDFDFHSSAPARLTSSPDIDAFDVSYTDLRPYKK